MLEVSCLSAQSCDRYWVHGVRVCAGWTGVFFHSEMWVVSLSAEYTRRPFEWQTPEPGSRLKPVIALGQLDVCVHVLGEEMTV